MPCLRLFLDDWFFSFKKNKLGTNCVLVSAQVRFDRPVLFRNKRFDFPFSFTDELERHGLDASCRQP